MKDEKPVQRDLNLFDGVLQARLIAGLKMSYELSKELNAPAELQDAIMQALLAAHVLANLE